LRRFAIFGGSFNPIHNGHLAMARQALVFLRLERVIFVPASLSPHKRGDHEMASPGDRLAMCRAAIRGRPGFAVWDGEINRGGVSYTINTLRVLRKFYGKKTQIFFLVGADALADLPSWRAVRQIMRLAQPVVLQRRRHPLSEKIWRTLSKRLDRQAVNALRTGVIPVRKKDVSATEIRRRIRLGRSVRGLLPAAVGTYAAQRGLYAFPE
jgi:nicotinate-nucleotide adenylyltransferase